ncbi:MAG: 4-alpha-glucanotransferase [Salegentibacter sp.]
MEFNRSSGILMHITSLASPFGIGDIGPAAYEFIDFLQSSGYKYWQLLPLNPTDAVYSHSPYSSHSAFAGNPLLISPELLEKEGFLTLKDFPKSDEFGKERVNFQPVEEYKATLIDAAFTTFKKKNIFQAEFSEFCTKHESWLEDYTLYLALREKYENLGWTQWPEELRDRNPAALKKAQKELEEPIRREKFEQFLFFFQWEKLMAYAHEKQVSLIGDIPFYVNHESAECWAYPEYFKLDENKEPSKVSGVPPDMFSETGQLWGTPVFHWKNLKQKDFDWWIKRLGQNLLLFDLVRLDHFRAFSAFWEVPAGETTAIHGKWVKTPGVSFFKELKKDFPEMPFIAEDLGSLDEPVYQLLARFNFPGMKVLQFAFGGDRAENTYLPFNHTPHNLVYTGTHDNNTCRGWYKNANKKEKEHLREYSGRAVTTKNVHEIFINMALKSVCRLAIIPMQDIIGLGEEGIMNIPASARENWIWRITPQQMPSRETIENLRRRNILFGRFKEDAVAE